jgi:hypothetical protein
MVIHGLPRPGPTAEPLRRWTFSRTTRTGNMGRATNRTNYCAIAPLLEHQASGPTLDQSGIGLIRLELLYFPHDRSVTRSAAAFKIVLHGPTVD